MAVSAAFVGTNRREFRRCVEINSDCFDETVSSFARSHATLVWRGGNFVLTDASSYGTLVHLGMPNDGVLLRRTHCYLSGAGFIVPGCERGDENAPLITFLLKS